MNIPTFLREFREEQFPQALGPEISITSHDPQWTLAELRKMHRAEIIVFDEAKLTYRLTAKATARFEQMKRDYNVCR